MGKPNIQTVRITITVVLLIILAAFMRVLGRIDGIPDIVKAITGSLRAFIYIGLFSTWGFSLRYRIIQPQVRRYLTAVSVITVFWMAVRTLKYNFFNDSHIERYLWYLYYLPILFIPLFSLLIGLSLGKSESFRVPKWTNILFGVSVLFFLTVLTNDIHQFVFGFPNGLMSYDNGEYTHCFCYYLIIVWVSVCLLTAFAVIIMKCRVPYSKRLVFYPCIPLLLLVLYSVLYLTAFDTIKYIAGDMTVIICLLTVALFESCIQCGLIQSNTHYTLLFECSSIGSVITDGDYNILLSSAGTEPLSEEIICRAGNYPVILDNGTRLCSAPVKYGYVIWSEDVSELTEVISELADNSEYLTARKTILQREVETRREEQRLTEQIRLYNVLMNQSKKAISLYSDLIKQLEATNDTVQEKKLTAKLAVVCTHIKRQGNLIFLFENSDRVNASEVRFAIEEWLADLRLCNVRCSTYFNINTYITYKQIVSIYDILQQVLLYTLDTLHTVLISADGENGNLYLLLNLSCDCDLSDISVSGVSISDEGGGEWVVKINASEGGLTV